MNYHQYNTPQLVTIRLAEFIRDAVSDTLGTFHLALSLEDSAEVVSRVLVSEPFRSSIDWSRVHIHLLYEELLEEGRHRARVEHLLKEPLGLTSEQIHGVSLGETNASQASIALQRETRSLVSQINGYPQFDLALLEVGLDGHIASVYPNELDFYISEAAYDYGLHTPDVGAAREFVTVTLSALEESKRLVYLALGPEVRYTIGHIINLQPQAKNYPANYLAGKCPWIHLFADDQAMREKSYSIY